MKYRRGNETKQLALEIRPIVGELFDDGGGVFRSVRREVGGTKCGTYDRKDNGKDNGKDDGVDSKESWGWWKLSVLSWVGRKEIISDSSIFPFRLPLSISVSTAVPACTSTTREEMDPQPDPPNDRPPSPTPFIDHPYPPLENLRPAPKAPRTTSCAAHSPGLDPISRSGTFS